MKAFERLSSRIIGRVNVNLRERGLDVGPFVKNLFSAGVMAGTHAHYGMTPHLPLYFRVKDSGLAGSYILGKCEVEHSLIFASDLRGDELKLRDETLTIGDLTLPVLEDEVIVVKDSALCNTLVHNFSHDPELPEWFLIQNSLALHYSNIHGSPLEGCFLAPMATVDLTTARGSLVGTFAYVQVGEIIHQVVEPGEIWIQADGAFEFHYRHPAGVLEKYVAMTPEGGVRGSLIDFIEARKPEIEAIFDQPHRTPPIPVPPSAHLSRYAVIKGDTRIAENVFVSQRSYLDGADLGPGANAQENCFIINSRLETENITAHGGKIIHATLGARVFVGFNSFVNGKAEAHVTIGGGSIVMPHTIIDADIPLEIPGRRILWGCIRSREDLETHSLSLDQLSAVDGEASLGGMRFTGSGSALVQAFQRRIEHILEANGAYFNGTATRGHAQKSQNAVFNNLPTYTDGECQGLCPDIHIQPPKL
ncbi:MAG: transferase [Proteobacteria bacterium]|nr:transferase [Pseudomonadota bacterium]